MHIIPRSRAVGPPLEKNRKEQVLKPEVVQKYAMKKTIRPSMKDTPIKIPQYKPTMFGFMSPATPKQPMNEGDVRKVVTKFVDNPPSQSVAVQHKPQWYYSRPLPTTSQQTSRTMYAYTNGWNGGSGGAGSVSRQDYELANPWMNI